LLSVNASVILHPFEEIAFLLTRKNIVKLKMLVIYRGGLAPSLLPPFVRQNSIFCVFGQLYVLPSPEKNSVNAFDASFLFVFRIFQSINSTIIFTMDFAHHTLQTQTTCSS